MLADPSQRRDPLGAGGAQRLLVALQGSAGAGQRLLFGGDRVARVFDLVLAVAQAVDDPPHLVAQVADAADHGLVHAVQAVEIFGPGGEVVDPAGADDDAEHVRGAGLIHRDQAVAQGVEGALEPGPQLLEVVPGDVELGDGLVEFGLLGLEPGADRFLAAADRRHLAGEAIDLVAVVGDGGRQHALLLAHFVQLRLLGFEFGFEILGRSRAGDEQRAERRYGEEERHRDGAVLEHRPEASQAPIPARAPRQPCNRPCDQPFPGAFSTCSRAWSASSSICRVVCSIPNRSASISSSLRQTRSRSRP